MRLKDKAGPCSTSLLLPLVLAVFHAKTTSAASLWKTASQPDVATLGQASGPITMTDNLDSNGMVKRSGIVPAHISGLYDAAPATFAHETYGAEYQDHAGLTQEQFDEEGYLRNVASEPRWTYSQGDTLEEAAEEIAQEQARRASKKGGRRSRKMLQTNDVPPMIPFTGNPPAPPYPYSSVPAVASPMVPGTPDFSGLGPQVTSPMMPGVPQMASPMIPGQSYGNVPPAPPGTGIPADQMMPTDPKLSGSDRAANAFFSSDPTTSKIVTGVCTAGLVGIGATGIYCACKNCKKNKAKKNRDNSGGQVAAEVRNHGQRLPPQQGGPPGGYMQKRSIEPFNGNYVASTSGAVPGIEYSAYLPNANEASSHDIPSWEQHQEYMKQYQVDGEHDVTPKSKASGRKGRKMLDKAAAEGPSSHYVYTFEDPSIVSQGQSDIKHPTKNEKIAIGAGVGGLSAIGLTTAGVHYAKKKIAKKATSAATEGNEGTLQKRSEMTGYNANYNLYNAPNVNLPEVYGQETYQSPANYEGYNPEMYADYEAYQGPPDEEYANQLAYQMANQELIEEDTSSSRRRRSKKGKSGSSRRQLQDATPPTDGTVGTPDQYGTPGQYGTPAQYGTPDQYGQYPPPGADGNQGAINPMENPNQYGSNFHNGEMPENHVNGYALAGGTAAGILSLGGIAWGVDAYCNREARKAAKEARKAHKAAKAAAAANGEGGDDIEAPAPPPAPRPAPPPAAARPGPPPGMEAMPPSRERMPPAGGRPGPSPGAQAAGGRGGPGGRAPGSAGGRGMARGAGGPPGMPQGGMPRGPAPAGMRPGGPTGGGPPQRMPSGGARPAAPRPPVVESDLSEGEGSFTGDESEYDDDIMNHPPQRPYRKRSLPSVLEAKSSKVIDTPSQSRAFSSGRRDLFSEDSNDLGKRAVTWSKQK